MKAAIPYMIKQGGGSIINIASLAGVRCLPNMPAYCASKGGLIPLTLQAALEYGPRKIRSNVVAPGATRTKMLIEALSPVSKKIGKDAQKVLAKSIPLRRTAEPEEIAGTCSFLASARARTTRATRAEWRRSSDGVEQEQGSRRRVFRQTARSASPDS